MGLDYKNLNADVRAKMVAELAIDIADRSVYVSPRLNAQGRQDWVGLIRTAAEGHNDVWLAQKISERNILNADEQYTRDGVTRIKKVASNANETLAEGEFNRLYIRGLCTVAIGANVQNVIVYRGRESRNPRPGSEEMIGQSISAEALRRDLREHKGQEPELLPHVNSGLTVRLP